MPRVPRHRGRHPKESDGFTCLATLQAANGQLWSAYQSAVDESGWSKIKLAVQGRAVGKGNYWLSWNGRRFAVHIELGQLVERRPELHQALLKILQEQSGLDLI